MKKNNYILILVLIFALSSCKNEKGSNRINENILSDLQVDHLNIWVKNPKNAKARLTDIGFTSVPDSLSAIHKGQGTAGRYFHFLNNYLELIFVYDKKELEQNNLINKNLDFTVRANFENNGASPFSVGLKVKNYDIEKIPFKKIRYHQDWMEENEAIYCAKNSKTNLKEPSIFVVYPEIEAGRFESLAELGSFPSKDSSWKEYFKHPNGAKKITKITLISTDLNLASETIKAVNGIENLSVKNGTEHLMELYFDNNVQEKSFDLRPELPLVIHL